VYALVLWIGLSLIGIPSAILWAVLTLVLRFLPYVGLWISAFFPLVLSVALAAVDVYYVIRRVISPIYLADGAPARMDVLKARAGIEIALWLDVFHAPKYFHQ
jgi:hypothetical protein